MTAAALFPLARRALFCLDAETAHGLTIKALKAGLGGRAPADPQGLAVEAFGLRFPNPVGLAAGFDKNAEVPDAMLALGMGFTEVGTVTPRPQAGNPRPRLFRLAEDRAVINRMGFNNEGLEAAKRRLAARQGRPGIVGANIGANKDSEDRIGDYVTGLEGLHGLASYFTVNVSSPNTPGLRDLQAKASLLDLIGRLHETRDRLTAPGARPVPMLLKIAPDLSDGDIQDVADVALETGLDGLIVSNTTIARPQTLQSASRGETGGLSGAPLMAPSTAVLARLHGLTGGRVPLVGAGGIASAADAAAKMKAGATLVQVYSALVYQGPALIGKIKQGLMRGEHRPTGGQP